jgi:antirestriction protein ArdC
MATKQFKGKSRAEIEQDVTDLLIKKLEEGTAPWQKEWRGTSTVFGGALPRSLSSKKAYRGINPFMLELAGYESPWWATWNQITKTYGGRIKREECGNSTMVIFWKWLGIEDKDTGKKKMIPFLRYYQVYNVEQCTGLESIVEKRNAEFGIGEDGKEDQPEFKPVEEAQAIVDGMPKAPPIKHGGDRAFYAPDRDYVRMPKQTDFNHPHSYYHTLFHELAHSTGHKSRVGRDLDTNFGSDKYGKEELIAEMTASILSGMCGLTERTIDNTASYLQGWIETLKGDSSLAIKAAGAASKATDWILDIQWAKEEAKEEAISA